MDNSTRFLESRGTGNPGISDMKTIAPIIIVVLIVLLLVIGFMIFTNDTSKKHPLEVVVGPVDPSLGIQGIGEWGMTRNEMIRILGPPLIPRDLTMGPYDMDPRRMEDYMPGIYADTCWTTNDDRLMGLSFGFDQFYKLFRVELKVYMVIEDRGMMLTRKLTLDEARSPTFGRQLGLPAKQIRVRENDVYIYLPDQEIPIALHFSYQDDHLESAYFHCNNNKHANRHEQ